MLTKLCPHMQTKEEEKRRKREADKQKRAEKERKAQEAAEAKRRAAEGEARRRAQAKEFQVSHLILLYTKPRTFVLCATCHRIYDSLACYCK